MHQTMIHQWKKALLDGAADIFERGGKMASFVDEDTVRSLHAKIGAWAPYSRKLGVIATTTRSANSIPRLHST
ncbi:hypothetical protein [Paracoccus sp. Ld10]|uniref:hypothetical protein n=1 Tax=Paracoccus sp. Ld10 TaxID=649158 RepID=UPI0038677007